MARKHNACQELISFLPSMPTNDSQFGKGNSNNHVHMFLSGNLDAINFQVHIYSDNFEMRLPYLDISDYI